MMQVEGEVILPAKRSKVMERWDECDRLSNLPNELLFHIFSFLNLKQVVQSCVLSKQWVKFWTLLPDLDFNSLDFKYLRLFDKFVNKVLTHRNSSATIRGITFFRLGSCQILAKRIVKYALSHRVQHFEISYRYLELSYPCDSVRTMKLLFVRLKQSLCLKNLVSLYLCDVNLESCENFSGCPNLEKLTLKYCFLDEMLHIVAPQLSRLCIEMCRFRPNCKIVLSTPRLTFMKFLQDVPCVSRTNELPLLEAIDIELYDHEEEERLDLVSVLKCFFNVKRMRLSKRVIQILSKLLNMSAQEPSPFCNMEVLNIIPSQSCKLFTIPDHVRMYLLGNSPHAKIVVEEKR